MHSPPNPLCWLGRRERIFDMQVELPERYPGRTVFPGHCRHRDLVTLVPIPHTRTASEFSTRRMTRAWPFLQPAASTSPQATATSLPLCLTARASIRGDSLFSPSRNDSASLGEAPLLEDRTAPSPRTPPSSPSAWQLFEQATPRTPWFGISGDARSTNRV